MNFVLKRDPFHGEHRPTMGDLYWDDVQLATLERPWNDNKGDIAGASSDEASCIYPAVYDLLWHERPRDGDGDGKKDQVVALYNPDVDVYYTKDQIPQEKIDLGDGRYLILIHPANMMKGVIGCIAPGLFRTTMSNEDAVGSSQLAMAKLMAAIRKHATTEFKPGVSTGCTLDIRQANAPAKFG